MKNVIILAVAATLFVACNNKPQVPENAMRELTDSVSALGYIRYEVCFTN